MAYVKAPIPSEVYHLTKKANLESILDDGTIRRFDDTECWFCESLAKMKAYMEQTVLCEGKPYYGAGGQLCRYPKFEPDEHIILKLTPCRREGNWYAPAYSHDDLDRSGDGFETGCCCEIALCNDQQHLSGRVGKSLYSEGCSL